MKRMIFTALILVNTAFAFGQQTKETNFTISGKIKGKPSGFLFLSYLDTDGKYMLDSAKIKNGAYLFKGKIAEPEMATIMGSSSVRNMDDPNLSSIFIEPKQMSLTLIYDDFKNLKLTGSASQDDYSALEKQKASIYLQTKPISVAYKKANEVFMQASKDKKSEAELDVLREKAASIKDQFKPFYLQQDKLDLDFIKQHPNSFYSAYLLRWKVSSLPLADSKNLYSKMSEKIKQSSAGKGVWEEIKSLEGGSPGSVASIFSTKDINGEQLNLADFKGKKYVLLDFWASWCVPCRKGNPHLLSLYSKYKDKGLEIIGISDDDSNPIAWKKAVEKDGIGVWKHVLRGLKRTENGFDRSTDISAPYGIHSLPTKILIDKNGVIIGRYGEGSDEEAMDKKLIESFNAG